METSIEQRTEQLDAAGAGCKRTYRVHRVFWVLLVVVAMLDQLTKAWALDSIEYHRSIEVIPGLFNLTMTYNYGVAFGVLAGLDEAIRGWVLWSLTLCAVSMVLYLVLRHYACDRVGCLALGLVAGGALGNMIDRARFGYVVDFLDFYYGSYHWPAFNIADSAICIGVTLLIFRPVPLAAPVASPQQT